jgi:iron complex transport system ATP-binding protein
MSKGATAAAMAVERLGFAYRRGTSVIQDVTLSVAPGRLHVLLGPNAAGKSTLMKLMLGMLSPGSGSVTIEGKSVARLPADHRAAWISHVPQRSTVAFAFGVRQVVAMGRYMLKPDEEAIDAAMAWCELDDLADRPFTELSVGQQQRVLLARAIAQSAGQGRLMLLDEPTSAMDLSHVHRTMALLRRTVDLGLAVVVVLQDLNLAARYADHVFLLQDGRLVGDGAWNDVLQPTLLQEVYGVSVNALRAADDRQRPVFEIQPLPPVDGV